MLSRQEADKLAAIVAAMKSGDSEVSRRGVLEFQGLTNIATLGLAYAAIDLSCEVLRNPSPDLDPDVFELTLPQLIRNFGPRAIDLRKAELLNVCFHQCQLIGADFTGAHVGGTTSFIEANLTGARMVGLKTSTAGLDLTKAQLIGALSGVRF